MHGLGLIAGHLLGDFILQNDYLAKNKASSTAVCALHCLIYTLAVWALNAAWLPIWAVVLVGLTHFPIDRFGLAGKLMDQIGQYDFKRGALSPWSIVAVDQSIHMLELYALGVLAEESTYPGPGDSGFIRTVILVSGLCAGLVLYGLITNRASLGTAIRDWLHPQTPPSSITTSMDVLGRPLPVIPTAPPTPPTETAVPPGGFAFDDLLAKERARDNGRLPPASVAAG